MASRKKSKVKTEKKDEFTLDIIQELGGTKADYEMLLDMNDDKDAIDHQEDFETEPVNKDDIRGFMEEIGLGDYRRQRKMEEEEEKERELENKPRNVQLAVMPNYEEEEKTEEETLPVKADSKKTKKQKMKEKGKEKEREVEGSQGEKKAKEGKKSKKSIQVSEISSTSDTPLVKAPLSLAFIHHHRPRKQLLLKPEGKWYENEFPDEAVVSRTLLDADVTKLEQFATRLLEEDTALYKKQEEAQRKSDMSWMRTVLKSGTLQDKMAALTVLIQDSPVHNMAALDNMVGMVKKKGRREALLAVETMRDLFLSDLLPDRKLKTFDQQPLQLVNSPTSSNKDSRDKQLLLWYFEAQLKDRYAAFVKALETLAHDTVSGPKKKAVAVIHQMLTEKPEQEKALLSLLVNKLGDPDYKVASQASHLLVKLVASHPNMKFVVVLEVERLLYRSNISTKAQYYAVCFLNQLLLGGKDKTLAARLISIYFSFFKTYVKRGEVDSKMLSALLSGVNRAFPFAKMEREKVTEQMDMLYKVVHVVSFNTSIQALMLLYQVMDTSDKASERFYTALYRKMLDPTLKASSKQTLFLNLLFKSMKKDSSERRVQAFLKRLLQVCCHLSPPFVCAALILVSELVKVKPSVLQLTQTAGDSDDEDEHFMDAPEEEEEEESDEKEGEKESPGTEAVGSEEVKVALKVKGVPTVSSWVHRQNMGDQREMKEYDLQARNPLYCRADLECAWELQRLSRHFHPTVALWAHTLLKGDSVQYTSDPLQDFTLIRFLDRFVFRNPKKQQTGQGAVLSARHRLGRRELVPVNSDEYLQLGEEGVPVDERFFYRYFSKKAAKKQDKEREEPDSDASEVSDSEFDDYLENFEKGLLEEGKKELDFAGEMAKQKVKGKKKRRGEEESDEEEDVDDLSDEEVTFGDLEGEFDGLLDDDDVMDDVDEEDDVSDDDEEGDDAGFDEEDVEFSDDGELEDLAPVKGKRKGKRSKDDEEEDDMFGGGPPMKKGRSAKGGGGADLFASAEEFAHLMDENVGSKLDLTGHAAFSNKDNAHAKQIKWEADRERWMRDGGRKQKTGRGKFPRKGGKFGKGGKSFKKGRK